MKLFPLLVPAGSDTQVQYNNGGLFGGDSTFTFNDSTKDVTMQGLVVTSAIDASANSVVFQPAVDATTFFQVLDADGGTPVLNIDSTNERVGIRTATPLYALDIADEGIMLGCDVASPPNRTDSVWKGGRIFVPHYDNDVLPLTVFWALNSSTTNLIGFGGGTNQGVNSTRIEFYAAANNTTVGSTVDVASLTVADTSVQVTTDTPTTVGNLQIYDTSPYGTGVGGMIGFFGHYSAAADYRIFGSIRGVKSNATLSNYAGDLVFHTRTNGISLNEKMRLNDVGFLGLNEAAPETLTEWTHETPYLTLHNNTHEDTDGGRESRLNFKGEQSGQEETTLARIEVSHDGALDDQKGKIVLSTNDGTDADTPTERLRISSAGVFTLTPDADTDLTINFIGTTNSGVLYWMEDEDYFKFGDDILMNSTEKVHFLDTAIGIYSQADTFLDIFADGGVRIGDSAAGAPTNYSKFESDGTLVFNGTATVWNDANIGAMMLALPAASQPDEVQFVDELGANTGIYTWGFAIGEKVSGAIEIPHDYKEGSDITFHVHWQGITAPAGGTDNIKWQLTYTVSHLTDTLNAVTTIVKEEAYTTQYAFQRTDFTAITGTNFDVGDQFLFVIERIAASADDYAGDLIVATVGFHYECDTCGSRTITTK